MKKVMLMALGVCGSAFAAEWQGSATDRWSNASCWNPQVVPTEGQVNIASGKTLVLFDEDFALLGGITSIYMDNGESKIVVSNQTEVAFDIPVNGAGTVYKYCEGTLHLNSIAAQADYNCSGGWRVEEGTLALPCFPEKTHPAGQIYINKMYVNEGATLETMWVSGTSNTAIMELTGTGTITNRCTSGDQQLRINGTSGGSFAGVITPHIRLYSSGVYNLTGEESTFGGLPMLWSGGVCGVMKFGNPNEKSSLGMNGGVCTRDGGGKYIYLGKGETTTKDFSGYNSGTCPHTISGGENGGLIIAGKINYGSGAATVERVELSGDNVTPCEVTGAFTPSGSSNITLAKRGSGKWILHNNANTTWTGLTVVEAGTLAIDTLTAIGMRCALGKGTKPYPDKYLSAQPEEVLPYQILLKGTADSNATLEYIGSTLAESDRVLAVDGVGRWLSNAGTVSLANVMALENGGELQVDGTSALTLKSSSGPLSITKVGTGAFTLMGEHALTGTVEARSGTLNVVKTQKFKWFRLTVKEIKPGDSNTVIQEFGLYDKDGNRLNVDMTVADAGTQTSLAPNSICFNKTGVNYYTNRGLDKMLDDVCGSYPLCFTRGGYTPTVNNPDSWTPITMRLADDCADVASYDIAYNATTTRTPTHWLLEGSVDGISWFKVDEKKDMDKVATKDNDRWFSDPSVGVKDTTGKPHTGFPIDASKTSTTMLNNAKVAAAAGATLAADGISVSGIKLGAANGTIRGVNFGSNTVLELAAEPTGSTTLPVTFEDCDFSNARITSIVYDGTELSTRYTARFTSTGVNLSLSGTLIFIR